MKSWGSLLIIVMAVILVLSGKNSRRKCFPITLSGFFAAELVLALEYLHGLGIVYRDLKPENIMVQENGLVDFDLSTKISMKSENLQPRSPTNHSISSKEIKKKKKRFPILNFCSSGIGSYESERHSEARVNSVRSDSEKSNSFVGAEEYVAPEIISGNGHDFSVDWWGLGVVLYEMLYGKTSFRGVNRQETFFRILTLTPQLVGE
ncbi:serine/threonine-protein kinase OXI1-like [Papaver somniferum]|uniref:serine/threonine-protein kinase OXI1-like n=1 Tax=Papaver somniferum TaxID=3469 RepID=UPI000E6F79D9|nr:serine/threonine-protein kinase OXI1-like [Papaver somniferum]